MKGWSLRTRLAVWTLVVGGFFLILFGGLAALALKQSMLGQIDATLRYEAGTVVDGLATATKPMDWRDDAQVRKFFSAVLSLYVLEVEQPLGIVVHRSGSIGNVRLPAVADDEPSTVLIGTSDVARLLQITRGSVRVRVAVDLSPMRQWERRMWTAMAIAVPAVLVLLGIAGLWISGLALAPFEEIAASAERITAERLDQRLPTTETADELGHLTQVLNRMLDRLQQSVEQARRFSADASHELKTPLTILHGEIEIALHSENLPPAVEKTLLGLLEETDRLAHIVEGLLFLSRADSGRLDIQNEPVDLTELIHELVEDIEILAAPNGIKVDTNLASGVMVSGSAQFLRQVMLNLFDNAIKFNVKNGTVRVKLSVENRHAVVTVANTGVQIAPLHRERVFVRFFRAESARRRDRSRGGHGLGLSICREIVHAHGGAITLETDEPGWTKFRTSFPLLQLPAGNSVAPGGGPPPSSRSG